MVALRSFLVLLTGYATMAVIVVVFTALIARLTPSWVGDPNQPKPGYIFVNLGYSFLAAAAGGYVTAWLAAANPLGHLLALAIVVLALSALNALFVRGRPRIGYQLALVALTPLGVLAGGLLRLGGIGVL
jgi:hypothetical protein